MEEEASGLSIEEQIQFVQACGRRTHHKQGYRGEFERQEADSFGWIAGVVVREKGRRNPDR